MDINEKIFSSVLVVITDYHGSLGLMFRVVRSNPSIPLMLESCPRKNGNRPGIEFPHSSHACKHTSVSLR